MIITVLRQEATAIIIVLLPDLTVFQVTAHQVAAAVEEECVAVVADQEVHADNQEWFL
jgi:hypothetical protein